MNFLGMYRGGHGQWIWPTRGLVVACNVVLALCVSRTRWSFPSRDFATTCAIFIFLFECQSPSLVSSVVVKLLQNCGSMSARRMRAKNAREAVGAGEGVSNWVWGWKPRACSLQAPNTIRPTGHRLYTQTSAKSRRAFGRRSAQDRGWLCSCRTAMSVVRLNLGIDVEKRCATRKLRVPGRPRDGRISPCQQCSRCGIHS